MLENIKFEKKLDCILLYHFLIVHINALQLNDAYAFHINPQTFIN